MEFLLGDWRFGTDPAENQRCNVPYFCGCPSCWTSRGKIEKERT